LVTIGSMTANRPRETEAERADRNFGDLLQELRVAQTGVQILFAFLLTLPLQARFEKLDDWEIGTFVTCLLLSAGASVCLIAPVAYHRALFARQMKDQVVKAASRFAIAGLTLLGLAIICAVHLVLDLVLGRTPALIIAGILAVVLTTAWAILPLFKRHGADVLNGWGNRSGPGDSAGTNDSKSDGGQPDQAQSARVAGADRAQATSDEGERG
jgi:hypothetical protein